MFFDRPRTWILYEPMDRDKSLLLAMTSSFHYFILSISLSLVRSYSSNGTQFISVNSIIYKVQRKGGLQVSTNENLCISVIQKQGRT